MTSSIVVGSTGLVGSHILSTLLQLPIINAVTTYGRRAPSTTDTKLSAVVEDSTKWASSISALKPAAPLFFSALGTTRAAAGGFENQRKIDYDLNLEVAKAAKQAGVRVYVLISSHGADSTSRMGYPKMKGELEDAVKALDFEKTVIVKPGLIVGDRQEFRGPEAALRNVAKFVGRYIGTGWTDPWAQDADVIAKAAIHAGLKALAGDGEKVQIVKQADIVRLGRTEWDQCSKLGNAFKNDN